jgi:PAS domain-containing protein
VAAVLLAGARAGYLATGLSLAMYAGFAALARLGVLERWLTRADNPRDLGFWLEAGAALAVFLVTLTGLVQRFHRQHTRTLAASFRAGADRARLTDELRERQERLDLVVQATNDGIWDWVLATNKLYLSPRWKQMLGYAGRDRRPIRFLLACCGGSAHLATRCGLLDSTPG